MQGRRLAPVTVTDSPAVSSAERAYLHTKHLIIRGDLAGGQLISEGQICEEMGISRTPVHEAFLRLAAEQLLVLSSRKGAVVAPMSPREVQDLAEMRAAIEGAAALRIVREGGLAPDDLARLRTALDRQRAAILADDADAFIAADDEFHSDIVEAASNPIALHLFAQLRDRQQRIRNQLLRLQQGQLQPTFDDHTRLLELLEAGNADGFVSALDAHLARHQGIL
jgi:DNA-binding GntR family transcriptional regulator